MGSYSVSGDVKKFFVPELETLRWPTAFNTWATEYCRYGMKMNPNAQVGAMARLKCEELDRDHLNYAIIFALASMGYAMSAVDEFLHRRETHPDLRSARNDLAATYATAVGRLNPAATGPTLLTGPTMDMLRMLREFLDTPRGQLILRATHTWISCHHSRRVIGIQVRRCLKDMSGFALRRMNRLPVPMQVLADARKLMELGEPGVVGVSGTHVQLDIDWLAAGNLLPPAVVRRYVLRPM
jgi:hypothetical protein